jgi:glutaredoxin
MNCLKILLILVSVFTICPPAFAEESFRILSHDIVYEEATQDSVLVTWKGEVHNASMTDQTLCAYVTLEDESGRKMIEFETVPLRVRRSGVYTQRQTFIVKKDIWDKSTQVTERVAVCESKPVITEKKIDMKIELYGVEGCDACSGAKNYLHNSGLEYTYYDLSTDRSAVERMEAMGQFTVPALVIEGELKLAGFDEKAFDRIFHDDPTGNGDLKHKKPVGTYPSVELFCRSSKNKGCIKALDYLEDNEVDYVFFNCEESRRARIRLCYYGRFDTFPVLIVAGKVKAFRWDKAIFEEAIFKEN